MNSFVCRMSFPYISIYIYVKYSLFCVLHNYSTCWLFILSSFFSSIHPFIKLGNSLGNLCFSLSCYFPVVHCRVFRFFFFFCLLSSMLILFLFFVWKRVSIWKFPSQIKQMWFTCGCRMKKTKNKWIFMYHSNNSFTPFDNKKTRKNRMKSNWKRKKFTNLFAFVRKFFCHGALQQKQKKNLNEFYENRCILKWTKWKF